MMSRLKSVALVRIVSLRAGCCGRPVSIAGRVPLTRTPARTMSSRCRVIAAAAVALLSTVACGSAEPTATPGSLAPTPVLAVPTGELVPSGDATATPGTQAALPSTEPVSPLDTAEMASPVADASHDPVTPDHVGTTTSGRAVNVPLGLSPILDGVLEPAEWDGALQDNMSDGSELFLMHDGEYLYAGIRASAKGSGVASICIDRGEQVSVLHSSAALGTAIYEEDGTEWQQIQAFSWRCRSTGKSAAAQDERSEFLQAEGWLANNGRMGAPEEVEYQIAMPEGALRLAMAFLGPPSFDSVAAWPQDLGDGCQNMELLTGPIPERMQFSPQTWTTVFPAGSSLHSPAPTYPPTPFPTGTPLRTEEAEWQMSTPEEQGMDRGLLDEMMHFIDEMDLPLDSVIIVRHGNLVLEEYPNPRYGPEEPHILYSTTKSVTSALIGIAIGQGAIESVDQQVADFFSGRRIAHLDARKRSMTLEHLLTMSCGFEWEGPDDHLHTWGQALRSGNPIQFMLDQPLSNAPGTEWYYNGGCSHLLSAILTEATGRSTLGYAHEFLFAPLGITKMRWPRDPQGIYFGGQDIWLRPRDMAKLGTLFLNGGEWGGTQVVPADWVARSAETVFTVADGVGYGYQWWTFPEIGVYFAAGAYEQRIYVAPDLDLVVVFTADNRIEGAQPGEIREGPLVTPDLMFRYILPACGE